MKKFLSLILCLTLAIGASTFTACGVKNNDSGYGNTQDTGSETTTYTVTFKQYNQPDVVRTVEAGESLTDIPTPAERTGYTVQWGTVDLTNITKNITVEAVETPNVYTITYDAGEGDVATKEQEVTFDCPYTLAVPEREDYIFQGWTYNGNAVLSGDKWTIAEDVTLVASWKDNRPTFTVSFEDGTSVKEISVKKGESVAAADVPEFIGQAGHTPHWDITDYTNIQSDMTVTAVYVPNVYVVTYDADGFELDGATVELTYGVDCTALDMSLTKETHDFLGWEYNGVTYTNTSKWNVAENVTLTAKWAEKEQVVITFTDTDGSIITRTGYEGEALENIPTPSGKTGYTVDTENWYTDAECTTVATFANLQESAVVYAKATPNKYTVTYDANGGNLDDVKQEVTFNAEYSLATPTHEKSYMRFDGWFDADGNKLAANGVWTKDGGVDLTAKWTDTRPVYSVSFLQSNQPVHTVEVKEGESVDLSEVPAPAGKIGYVVSWNTEGVDLTNVQSDITINAKETPKTYTLKLTSDANGSVLQTEITVEYNAHYDLSQWVEANVGYKLERWERNGVAFATAGTWTLDETNVELKAVHAAKVFTVYLHVNGGNALDTSTYTVTFGKSYTLPEPTHEKVGSDTYTFMSWRVGSAKGAKILTSGVWSYDSATEDIHLYAKWNDGYTGNY
ncbi:MAG: InlB B-repeat-containing protein [Clostridia bacterium]|nr:InlB B-repeat-containing protein [Clostridia bacterium]